MCKEEHVLLGYKPAFIYYYHSHFPERKLEVTNNNEKYREWGGGLTFIFNNFLSSQYFIGFNGI